MTLVLILDGAALCTESGPIYSGQTLDVSAADARSLVEQGVAEIVSDGEPSTTPTPKPRAKASRTRTGR